MPTLLEEAIHLGFDQNSVTGLIGDVHAVIMASIPQQLARGEAHASYILARSDSPDYDQARAVLLSIMTAYNPVPTDHFTHYMVTYGSVEERQLLVSTEANPKLMPKVSHVLGQPEDHHTIMVRPNIRLAERTEMINQYAPQLAGHSGVVIINHTPEDDFLNFGE